jgi:hypothetical protein
MEAHPVDAWQTEDNKKEKISVTSPKTVEERCAVENVCATKLALRIPAVVDNIANTTELAYTGWPDRLYVIDRDGRVMYKSKPGPFGFDPEGMEKALQRLLPAAASQQVSQLR